MAMANMMANHIFTTPTYVSVQQQQNQFINIIVLGFFFASLQEETDTERPDQPTNSQNDD